MEAAVTVSHERSGLTRFANSSIHQNVAEEGTTVSLTLEAEGRVAQATGKVADSNALARFVSDAAEAVRLAPVNDEWPGFTPPSQSPHTVDSPQGMKEATPDARASQVRAFVDAAPDLRGAGYCQTSVSDVVYANTLGHAMSGGRSVAILDGIHQTDESAGSGHCAARAIGDLDGEAVGALAAERARRGVGARDLPPGEFEVVLAPEAVSTLAIFLALYGFNAKAVTEGQSFVRLGEQQFDERFGLTDDALDPRALGLPFDGEGTPKRRLVLIENGVSRAVAVDRRQAPKLGTESTGHAVSFFGSYFGAIATSMFVTAGDQTVEELIRGVDKGLYVATFNYVRILDPRTTVATGLTRNGTFLIEKGEITSAVSNLRFTQSLAGAAVPGRVLGVGNDARLADGEFGPGMVHAPSLRLAGWRFTGGAGG
jgi:predicted Zn-dependent protease